MRGRERGVYEKCKLTKASYPNRCISWITIGDKGRNSGKSELFRKVRVTARKPLMKWLNMIAFWEQEKGALCTL